MSMNTSMWMRLDYTAHTDRAEAERVLLAYRLKIRHPETQVILWSGLLASVARLPGEVTWMTGEVVAPAKVAITARSVDDIDPEPTPVVTGKPMEVWLFWGFGERGQPVGEPKLGLKVVLEPGKRYGGWVGDMRIL